MVRVSIHPAGPGEPKIKKNPYSVKPRIKTREELERQRVINSRKENKELVLGVLKALLIAGASFGVVALNSEVKAEIKNESFNEDPRLESLDDEVRSLVSLYKYGVVNGEATKLYDSEHVYFIYDKDDCSCEEYLSGFITPKAAAVIYDLDTEKLLAYKEFGFGTTDINYTHFSYLEDANYEVRLSDASDYVEGLDVKDYYSLDEIKELGKKIGDGVKVLSKVR